MRFDFQYLLRQLPEFRPAASLATQVFAVAVVAAMAWGVVLALGRISQRRLPYLASSAYIEFFRNTPLLVQLYFVFFGLPLLGLTFSPFTSGAVALAAQHGAFFAEIYRGAIQGIGTGQVEAGRVLGMRWWDIMSLVVLPQALRDALPAIGNELSLLLLDTSLLSTIGVMEITLRGLTLAERSAASFEMFVAVGAIYLALSTSVSVAVRGLERVYHVVR